MKGRWFSINNNAQKNMLCPLNASTFKTTSAIVKANKGV